MQRSQESLRSSCKEDARLCAARHWRAHGTPRLRHESAGDRAAVLARLGRAATIDRDRGDCKRGRVVRVIVPNDGSDAVTVALQETIVLDEEIVEFTPTCSGRRLRSARRTEPHGVSRAGMSRGRVAAKYRPRNCKFNDRVRTGRAGDRSRRLNRTAVSGLACITQAENRESCRSGCPVFKTTAIANVTRSRTAPCACTSRSRWRRSRAGRVRAPDALHGRSRRLRSAIANWSRQL